MPQTTPENSPHRLSAATLADLPATVSRPRYDRAKLRPGIIHLGVGAFSRAHLGFYTEGVLATGALEWGIVGASLRSAATRDALAPQDGLYTLVVRGADGDDLRVMGSLLDVLTVGTDPEPLLVAMSDPGVRIVTITVTEKGYCRDTARDTLDESNPLVKADLATPEHPTTVPGLLVEALNRRRSKGITPFTVLSCDNLPDNGHKTRRVVCRFAELRDPELGRFITDTVAFPCTMVDRITPATSDQDRVTVAAAIACEDAWPVVTEPFHQWVIEDHFPAGRPRWEKVGAILVSDVRPFEVMKLRCLNGSHSSLAYIGVVTGLETVMAAMADKEIGAFIRRLWANDLVPTVPPVPGIEIDAYTRDLEQRFLNPAIRHRILQISMDGSQKLPPRLLEPALEALRAGRRPRGIAFAVAAWMRFVSGVDDHGQPYAVSDPLSDRLAAIVATAGQDATALSSALFEIQDIFPRELAGHPWFRDQVLQDLSSILSQGMRASLIACLAKVAS